MKHHGDGPLIVGFGHRRRVGKDTLAGMVRDRLDAAGVRAYRDAFAWKIKDIARKLFDYAGLGPADLYEREPDRREKILPAIGMSPRDLWISLGNKVRELVPDVWIRAVLDNSAYDEGCVMLVSDVRYPNEVQAIRERGGILVKVTREGIPEFGDPADSALADMPDDEWDYRVPNDRDLAHLASMADWLADAILDRLRA